MADRIPERIFISYSRKDSDWLAKVESQLSPLIRSGQIAPWIDRGKIEVGDRFTDEILEAIDTCSAAILLVSPNFQNSDFIHENELPRVLRHADNREIRLYWILVADCLLADDLRKYHAVNDSDTPLQEMTDGEVNRVLAKFARTLRHHVAEAKSNSEPETQEPIVSASPPLQRGQLKLQISSEREVTNPSSEEIREAVFGLRLDHDPYLILSEEGKESFLQCLGDAAEGFLIEYRDEHTDQQFRATSEDLTAEFIIEALVSYTDGTDKWYQGLSWVEIDV